MSVSSHLQEAQQSLAAATHSAGTMQDIGTSLETGLESCTDYFDRAKGLTDAIQINAGVARSESSDAAALVSEVIGGSLARRFATLVEQCETVEEAVRTNEAKLKALEIIIKAAMAGCIELQGSLSLLKSRCAATQSLADELNS